VQKIKAKKSKTRSLWQIWSW